MAVSSWTLADFRGVGQLYLGGAELSSLYLGPFLLWARSDVPMYDVSPKGLRSRPKLGSPEITSASGAGLKGVAAQPLLGTPSLSVMGLEPVGLSVGVAVGSPAAEEAEGFTATPIGVASTPILGALTVSSANGLIPTGILIGSVVGAPAVLSVDGVAPIGIAAGTRVGSPAVEEGAPLTAAPVGIKATPVVGAPGIGSVLGVVVTELAAGVIVGSPEVASAAGIEPVGLAVTPTMGEATISGASGVVPVGLVTQPTVGEPDVTSPSLGWEWTIGQSGTSYGVNGNSTGDGTTTSFGSLVPGMAGSAILYGLLSAGGAGDNIRCRVGASGNSQFPGSVSSFVMNIEGFGDVTMTWNSSLSLYAAVGTGARTYVTGQAGNTLTVTGFPT